MDHWRRNVESSSRDRGWLRAGGPRITFRMLGHANLQQTNTYLNVTKAGLRDSMERYTARGRFASRLQATNRPFATANRAPARNPR
jgi:hypothetical protein